jgi:hypothetical protein
MGYAFGYDTITANVIINFLLSLEIVFFSRMAYWFMSFSKSTSELDFNRILHGFNLELI